MQDRFKFRFWNKLSNIMTYNFMFGNFMQKSLEDYEKKDWVGLNYEPDYICFNNQGIEDNLVIMQCTGLKDKNGKLIYEGDIVKYLGGTVNKKFIKYITKWNNNLGQFYISKINPSEYDNWKDWHLGRHDLDYEVIGNIYENEDLLNGNR